MGPRKFSYKIIISRAELCYLSHLMRKKICALRAPFFFTTFRLCHALTHVFLIFCWKIEIKIFVENFFMPAAGYSALLGIRDTLLCFYNINVAKILCGPIKNKFYDKASVDKKNEPKKWKQPNQTKSNSPSTIKTPPV